MKAIEFRLLVGLDTADEHRHSTNSVSSHRHVMFGGVVTGDVVVQLPLQVGQQAGSAEAEQVGHQPFIAEFFLHQGLPGHGLLGFADAARRFETDLVAGALQVFTDGAHHHEADFQRGVGGFLAGGGLDEVRAGHHGHQTGLVDLLERAQFAGGKDGLHVGGLAAGRAELLEFIVKGLPVAGQHVVAGDDHVDLTCACFDGLLDLGDALGQGSLPGRETGRNGSNRDVRAAQRLDCIRHAVGVDADRADGDLLAVKSQPAPAYPGGWAAWLWRTGV